MKIEDLNFGEKSLNFDTYLQTTIGEFGRYQQLILIFLCIPACFVSAWGSMDLVFMAYSPTHSCNSTESAIDLINGNGTTANVGIWQEAKECSVDYTTQNSNGTNETVENDRCSSWTYDLEYFDRTIITEWQLVCDRAVVPRTILALLNLATLVAAGYSYVQDRWGRKRAFFINLTVFLVGSCGSLLSESPLTFAVLKFVGGITCMWEIGYCWTLEFAGPTHRTTVTTLLTVLYSIATASLGLVAYLCRTWVQIGFTTSVPFVLLYFYIFFVPESPRWLLSQGRTEEALKIIQSMARWNNANVDPDQMRHHVTLMSKRNDDAAAAAVKRSDNMKIMDFFRSKNLRWKNCLMVFVGIAANQLYYAVPYSLENLQGNFLAAYVLQALVEAPASLLNLLILNRFGRILPLSSMLFLGSLCCFLTWPFDSVGQYGAVLFAVAARFFIAAAVAILEQLEGELYPTVARGVGGSVGYVVYALVGVAAQYVIYTGSVWNVLPLIIMGSFTTVASVACLFLPETRGNDLPDTVEEAEAQGAVGLTSFINHFRCLRCCRSTAAHDTVAPVVEKISRIELGTF